MARRRPLLGMEQRSCLTPGEKFKSAFKRSARTPTPFPSQVETAPILGGRDRALRRDTRPPWPEDAGASWPPGRRSGGRLLLQYSVLQRQAPLPLAWEDGGVSSFSSPPLPLEASRASEGPIQMGPGLEGKAGLGRDGRLASVCLSSALGSQPQHFFLPHPHPAPSPRNPSSGPPVCLLEH